MPTTRQAPRIVPELVVSDHRRSMDFYCGVLGFTEMYGRPEDGFSKLDLDGAAIMIEQRRGDAWIADELSYPFGRGINLEINVDGADALYRACLAAGAKIFLPLEEKWYRGNDVLIGVRQFIVLDPDGYLLRLSQSIGLRRNEG